jgi:predicted membrane-bound mannosyltransferase
MVRGVSLLQYADYPVIFASGIIVQRICESLQKSLDAVSVFLSGLGLSISTTKSEVVFFSREDPSSILFLLQWVGLVFRFQRNSNTWVLYLIGG